MVVPGSGAESTMRSPVVAVTTPTVNLPASVLTAEEQFPVEQRVTEFSAQDGVAVIADARGMVSG